MCFRAGTVRCQWYRIFYPAALDTHYEWLNVFLLPFPSLLPLSHVRIYFSHVHLPRKDNNMSCLRMKRRSLLLIVFRSTVYAGKHHSTRLYLTVGSQRQSLILCFDGAAVTLLLTPARMYKLLISVKNWDLRNRIPRREESEESKRVRGETQ